MGNMEAIADSHTNPQTGGKTRLSVSLERSYAAEFLVEMQAKAHIWVFKVESVKGCWQDSVFALNMGKKKSLNAKRLTKKQVQELIESEGKLHEEFTDFFEETSSTGYKNQPQVYELPNDRFLFVFDPKGISIPGRGDIYSREHLLRRIRWHQRVRDDCANGRGDSISHWIYYSKHKVQLINKIGELIDELVGHLDLSNDQLDFSYKSLDTLSSKAEDYGLEKVQVELYDNLVAYIGEVMRRRVEGQWVVREDYSDCRYPIIGANEGVLMPINVVYKELDGYEPMNLRREAANEVRRFSLRYR